MSVNNQRDLGQKTGHTAISCRSSHTPTKLAWNLDAMANYKPGDIANGHMLGTDGVWRRVEESKPDPKQTASTSPQSVSAATSQIAAAFIVASSIVGVILSMQSVSLMTGTGILWTGAALAFAAAVAGLVMRSFTPAWARIVAILAAALAIYAAVSMEMQMEERRSEIRSNFSDIGTE